jgi:hypothetical protein
MSMMIRRHRDRESSGKNLTTFSDREKSLPETNEEVRDDIPEEQGEPEETKEDVPGEQDKPKRGRPSKK